MLQRLYFEDSCDDLELVGLLKTIRYEGARTWEGALLTLDENDRASGLPYIVESRNLLDLSLPTRVLACDRL